jgi:sigma-B regulation protein RsbU (phosphoserine phosphatase)
MDKDAGRIFEGSLTFEPKDRIILFTDGLTETMGEGGELYGLERLESFVKSSSHLLPVRLNNDLLAELNSFRKGPASDDIFLMTIDIK